MFRFDRDLTCTALSITKISTSLGREFLSSFIHVYVTNVLSFDKSACTILEVNSKFREYV